jgi:putative membrane protein
MRTVWLLIFFTGLVWSGIGPKDYFAWSQAFFIVCFCLALSAFYELVEWWVALLVGESADAFLGTQGYVWDTQSDMALALCGAIVSLFLLSKRHDQQLEVVSTGRLQLSGK